VVDYVKTLSQKMGFQKKSSKALHSRLQKSFFTLVTKAQEAHGKIEQHPNRYSTSHTETKWNSKRVKRRKSNIVQTVHFLNHDTIKRKKIIHSLEFVFFRLK
jgi:hypothetical protein